MKQAPQPRRLSLGDRALAAGASLLSVTVLLMSTYLFKSELDRLLNLAERIEHTQSIQVTIDRLHAQRLSIVNEIERGADADSAQLFQSIDDESSQALAELRAAEHNAVGRAAVDSVTRAYHAMVSTESDAFGFALAGRNEIAAQRLHEPAYNAARAEYSEAMSTSREILWANVQSERVHASAIRSRFAVLTFASATLFLGLWSFVYRRFRRRAKSLHETRVKLERSAAELTRRKRESQNDVLAKTPIAMAEFEFPPAAKLVTWLRARGVDDLDRWLKLYPGEIRKLAPRFQVTRMNPAAVHMLRAKAANETHDLSRWLPDRSIHICALEILRATWNNAKDVAFDIEATDIRGEPLVLSVSGHIARRAQTKRTVMVCSLVDVTEIRRLRQQLAEAQAATATEARARTDFISSVSHDLRSPLNGVVGMASALNRTPLDKEQRAMLGVVADAGAVMRDALDRAHDLAKIENNTLDIDSAPFDIDAVARAVDMRFGVQARAKNVRLRIGVDESARLRVTGDETRTRQILSKLISNAIRHTQRGEVEATLTMETEPDGTTRLVMLVRDTGTGLSDAEVARVLSTDATTSGGLSLCRRICEIMGGGMTITSSADYGAAITVKIVVTDSRPEPVAGTPEKPSTISICAGMPTGLRLLAADDNEINRIVLTDFLAPLNAELTLVENGAEALDAWRAHAFDAVLLDIQMPILNGYDVAREIRRLEAETNRARTPILALSAGVMDQDVSECFEAGMDAHVSKPIDPDELFDAIKQMVLAAREPDGDAEAPDAISA